VGLREVLCKGDGNGMGMAPQPSRPWSPQRRPEPHTTSCHNIHSNIIFPDSLVEIDGQEPAGLLLQQRVDANDMAPLQVIQNYLIRDLKKGLMRAFTAFHLRFLADPVNPLVGAGRGTALLSRPHILLEPGKQIHAPGEEGTEQGYLPVFGSRWLAR
jgi:hypothetical protein